MMRYGRLSLLVSLLLFSFMAEAESQGRFDGSWAIYISGDPGQCEFGYRISVVVHDGLVSWRGQELPSDAIGITAHGGVMIRLSDGTHVVTGSGAIDGHRGYGKWSFPAYRCAGLWRAQRL